eukprot:894475-Amphidinium_carterae.6
MRHVSEVVSFDGFFRQWCFRYRKWPCLGLLAWRLELMVCLVPRESQVLASSSSSSARGTGCTQDVDALPNALTHMLFLSFSTISGT